MSTSPSHRTGARAGAHRGFSLVELLVAMTLGLILIGGMMSVFAGNRRASDINVATTTIQESARFAMSVIASDVRMAGHQGCIDLNTRSVKNIAKSRPTVDLRETAIGGAVVSASGWDIDWDVGTGGGKFVPSGLKFPAVAGTHALLVQFGGPEISALDSALATPSAAVPLADPTLPVAAGDLALIATCEAGEIFQVTARSSAGTAPTLSHGASANDSGALTEAYGSGGTAPAQVRVMPFRSHVYYIGNTGKKNDAGKDIRALYQQSAPFNQNTSNPPVELVRGVENMRLSFGIDTGKGNLRYVTSDETAYDARKIRSVRIGLLMSSADPIAADADTKSYVLAGQELEPTGGVDGYDADERFRLAFNTTVKIRNRRATD